MRSRPIYDSNAQSAVGGFVNRWLVGPIRHSLADVPPGALAYRNLVAAFVVLRERISAVLSASRKPIISSGMQPDCRVDRCVLNRREALAPLGWSA